MQKKLRSMMIAILIIGFFMLTGCQRLSPQLTPAQQIVGKWTIKTAIGNYTEYSVNRKDTTRFTPADYFEFKADGTLAIMETNKPYNGNWQITNGKLFITNTHYIDYANGFDINTLTSIDLQLYYTEANSFSTLEQKLNLTK